MFHVLTLSVTALCGHCHMLFIEWTLPTAALLYCTKKSVFSWVVYVMKLKTVFVILIYCWIVYVRLCLCVFGITYLIILFIFLLVWTWRIFTLSFICLCGLSSKMEERNTGWERFPCKWSYFTFTCCSIWIQMRPVLCAYGDCAINPLNKVK